MHVHVFHEDEGSNPAAKEYEVLPMFDETDAGYASWRIRLDCACRFGDDWRYRYGQNVAEMKATRACPRDDLQCLQHRARPCLRARQADSATVSSQASSRSGR